MRNYFLIFMCIIFYCTSGQEQKTLHPWGFHFGYSTQQTAPFNLPDYRFEQGYVLGQLGVKKYTYSNINVQLFAESGYYNAQHQLINKWFTTTDLFKDFPENFQEKMLRKKTIHQLVFHAAVEVSRFINHNVQLFGYAAIGPMWTSQQTERLAKGFAFSDNIGLGVKFKLNKRVWLSHLIVIRHESNANLKFPNSGHNTMGVRFGLLFNPSDLQMDATHQSVHQTP